jgi:hypothetical protein
MQKFATSEWKQTGADFKEMRKTPTYYLLCPPGSGTDCHLGPGHSLGTFYGIYCNTVW